MHHKYFTLSKRWERKIVLRETAYILRAVSHLALEASSCSSQNPLGGREWLCSSIQAYHQQLPGIQLLFSIDSPVEAAPLAYLHCCQRLRWLLISLCPECTSSWASPAK